MVLTNGHRSPESLIRADALPSVWCSGCGLGSIVNVFLHALIDSDVDPENILVLSTGIGCTSKVLDYINLPSQLVLDESPVNIAIKLMLEDPKKKVVLFLDDADFIALGVEPFVQAGVKGADLLIVYFNNHVYRIFSEHRNLKHRSLHGMQMDRRSESPFNIPKMAQICGAAFIARWTPHHPRRLMDSIKTAFLQQALSVIEVISPCLMYYPNIGQIGERIDRSELYRDYTVIRNDEPTDHLDLRTQEKIVIGEFKHSEQ